jgi:hypothetical protein
MTPTHVFKALQILQRTKKRGRISLLSNVTDRQFAVLLSEGSAADTAPSAVSGVDTSCSSYVGTDTLHSPASAEDTTARSAISAKDTEHSIASAVDTSHSTAVEEDTSHRTAPVEDASHSVDSAVDTSRSAGSGADTSHSTASAPDTSRSTSVEGSTTPVTVRAGDVTAALRPGLGVSLSGNWTPWLSREPSRGTRSVPLVELVSDCLVSPYRLIALCQRVAEWKYRAREAALLVYIHLVVILHQRRGMLGLDDVSYRSLVM